MSATAAVVTRGEEESARNLTVATRRSKDDKYSLMFNEESRLVLADPIALAKQRVGDSKDVFEILKAHGLDWKDVKDTIESGVSRATWYRK